MGGGSKGLAKLRSGCVGRTQAVGMVLLGASSLLECSGCVGGSKEGCCGAGPSFTAGKKKKSTKNQQLLKYFLGSVSHFDGHLQQKARRCPSAKQQETRKHFHHELLAAELKNQMFLRAAGCRLKQNISSLKKNNQQHAWYFQLLLPFLSMRF